MSQTDEEEERTRRILGRRMMVVSNVEIFVIIYCLLVIYNSGPQRTNASGLPLSKANQIKAD